MQELGLYSIQVDAKKQFKRKQQYAKQNLLKREFSAGHPNQIWVSDITYFKEKTAQYQKSRKWIESAFCSVFIIFHMAVLLNNIDSNNFNYMK